MKKYFEYPINNKIMNEIERYYNSSSLSQHGKDHILKSKLKMERVEKIVHFKKKDVVLDIGCALGENLKRISKKIRQGVGVDLSKNIIKKAISNNHSKNIKFQCKSAEELSFKYKFDKILLLDIIEHTINPDIIINKSKKMIKNNGKIIIQVPFTGWLSELIFGEYHQGHFRYYDPIYLRKYLEKEDLYVENLRVYNSVPYSSFFLNFKLLFKLLNILVNIIPSKYYPYFGEIVVICER